MYEGVYCLAQRQFSRAAKLFLDSVATFTTYELFDYERCIFYTVVTSIITLPRLELKKKARPSPLLCLVTLCFNLLRTSLPRTSTAHPLSHVGSVCVRREVQPSRDCRAPLSPRDAHASLQVVDASEVLTVIHKLPGAQRLLNALYYCNYGEFFPGFLQARTPTSPPCLFLHLSCTRLHPGWTHRALHAHVWRQAALMHTLPRTQEHN